MMKTGNYSHFTLYMDESGDHSLEVVDPDYPLFILSCCVVTKLDYCTHIAPEIISFKHRWLGHEAVILHAHEIRKAKKDFNFLFNLELRENFQNDLTELIERLPFTLMVTAIDKTQLNYRDAEPDNPYTIAMQSCLEGASHFLHEQGETDKLAHVLVESRGRKEDKDLEQAFRRICEGSNALHRPFNFELIFVSKKQNLPGLQLADLVCHPIGRHLLKPAQGNRAYNIIKKKFRDSEALGSQGYGLKTFP